MDRSSARLSRSEGARRRCASRWCPGRVASLQRRRPHPGPNGTAYAGTLKPFGSCDTVLQYFKDEAPEYLINWAGGYAMRTRRRRRRAGERRGGTPARLRCGVRAAPPVHSTTNVQEAGVDEPDIVKTDGNRIVAVAQARVHLVGLSGGTMTLRKTLPDTGCAQRVPVRRPSAGVQRSDGRDLRARPALGRSAGRSDHVRHLGPGRSRAPGHADHRRRRPRRPPGGSAGPRSDGLVARRRCAVADLHPHRPHLGHVEGRATGRHRADDGRRLGPHLHPAGRSGRAGEPGTSGGMRRPGSSREVLGTGHRGGDVVRHGLGPEVPPDGGRGRRRTADLRDRRVDVRVDDRLEPRGVHGQDHPAQVRHRPLGREHLLRVG